MDYELLWNVFDFSLQDNYAESDYHLYSRFSPFQNVNGVNGCYWCKALLVTINSHFEDLLDLKMGVESTTNTNSN